MVWKTLGDLLTGDATHYGDVDGMGKVAKLFNGVADVDTCDINSPFKLQNHYYNGILNPPQITSQQNNYAPSTGDKKNRWRLDADANSQLITGISISQTEGLTRKLTNISNNLIMLMNQHGDSSAANRFEFGGYDIPLFPKQTVELIYDDTIDRWILDSQPNVIPPIGLGYYFTKEYARNNNLDWNVTAASGGTANNVAAIAKHFGVAEWTLGTSATGSGSDITEGQQWFFGNAWYHRYDAVFKILQLSNATDNYTLRLGWIDNATGESTDGLFFRYNHGVNSGKWQKVARNNAVETGSANDTGIAAQTSNFTRFTIVVYPAGNKVEYFIDGVSVGTETANIPTTSARVTGNGMMFIKTAGTTNTAFLQMDAQSVFGYSPVARAV